MTAATCCSWKKPTVRHSAPFSLRRRRRGMRRPTAVRQKTVPTTSKREASRRCLFLTFFRIKVGCPSRWMARPSVASPPAAPSPKSTKRSHRLRSTPFSKNSLRKPQGSAREERETLQGLSRFCRRLLAEHRGLPQPIESAPVAANLLTCQLHPHVYL